jgi:branched-chain amino acid transport system ATP-binding protein
MNTTEKVTLRELIDRIRRDGRTILLIEHDVKLVMGLCDRVTVLDYGKQIAEGTPGRGAAQREGDRGLSRRRPRGALGRRRHGRLQRERSPRVDKLRVAYGGIQAVKGVSFEVREGELVSLIGANGAGKTTTLKAITGTQPAAGGDIRFMGRSTRGQGPWLLVEQGLVMVPEGRGVFSRMTITENLQMGAFVRNDVKEIAADIDKVFAIFPAPEGAPQPARRHDERRRAADARDGTGADGAAQGAAARRAVDGLSPIMVDKIFEVVNDIHRRGRRSCSSSRTPAAPCRSRRAATSWIRAR